MKKVILPLILLMLGAALVALESAPSDVVGFVKVACNAGYTPFALPFTQYNTSGTETLALVDIVGPYMTGGLAFNADRIVGLDGTTSYKNNSGTFTGFQNFTLGDAYYMHNRHTAFNLYLAGKVEPEVIDFGTMGYGYNPVGIKEAAAVSLNDLDLLSSGFTGGLAFASDRIIDINTGGTAYYNTTTSAWTGFTTLTPGHAYYIQVRTGTGHAPFTWIYDPTSRGTNPTTNQIRNVNNTRR